ncbi:abortive infection phage resistance protein [Hyaloraphidium curvatum]|nr:abortive infection phage resistance protein [Hyaloraphidium curvatum]
MGDPPPSKKQRSQPSCTACKSRGWLDQALGHTNRSKNCPAKMAAVPANAADQIDPPPPIDLPIPQAGNPADLTFEKFKQKWIEDVERDNPSTTTKGNRFAIKLAKQWLEINDDSEDTIYLQGAGDGGIDVAQLEMGADQERDPVAGAAEDDAGRNRRVGNTWYLIQGKYNTAFQGRPSILAEAGKMLDTIDPDHHFAGNLSHMAQSFRERIGNFIRGATDLDKIVVVFGVLDPMGANEKLWLSDVERLFQERLRKNIVEVIEVSLKTIWDDLLADHARKLILPTRKVDLKVGRSNLVASEGVASNQIVGVVPLRNVFDFLCAFKDMTGDLDQLYDKNVRRFLAFKGRVNSGMRKTLAEAPENFGLYNNGVTIVVVDYAVNDDKVILSDPYVVNGCQTTRTIYDVCVPRLKSGAGEDPPSIAEWKTRLDKGNIIVKIAKVDPLNGEEVMNITRYTNSQNAVREKDFLALVERRDVWAEAMAAHGVFLEVQRGGWDSQRALQAQKPDSQQFKQFCNLYDLIKVYTAGWLSQPGLAFRGQTRTFAPGGPVFQRVTEGPNPIDANDLYAAYKVQGISEDDRTKFGRGSQYSWRRQSRFLFYFIFVDFIRRVLKKRPSDAPPVTLSNAIIRISDNGPARDILAVAAAELVDSYMKPDETNSQTIYKEELFATQFSSNLNAILKAEKLGDQATTPKLHDLLHVYEVSLSMINPISKEKSIQAAFNALQ